MGIRELEAAVLAELREVSGNKKLRQKDIMQWSTGDVRVEKGEKEYYLPKLAVHVAVLESGGA